MLLPSLPPDARLWIFTADRALTPEEQTHLRETLSRFVASWASHGRPVPGEVALSDDRFVLVGAHLEGGVSGCGIDSLVHEVETAGRALGVTWLGGLDVVYRTDEGEIRTASRPAFRQLARDGVVGATTPVFDTTLATVGALREEGLERPAGATWHARVFRFPEPV